MKLYQALDLKKLQTPLYEEFYNTLNATDPQSVNGIANSVNVSNNWNLPPKSRSPNMAPSRRLSAMVDATKTAIPGTGSNSKIVSNASSVRSRALQEIQPPQATEWKGLLLDAQEGSCSPRFMILFLVAFIRFCFPTYFIFLI